MKLGILISAAFVVALIAVVLTGLIGKAELATNVTSPAMLQKRLPDLPDLYTTGAGDASGVLEEMWAFFKEHRIQFSSDPPVEIQEQCVDLFIRALEAGEISGEFLDETTPIIPRAQPSFGDSMRHLADAAMKRAFKWYQDDQEKEKRQKAAEAVWGIGHQMFTKAKRLPVRIEGLMLMQSGGTELFNWSKDGSELGVKMVMVEKVINKYKRDYWGPKTGVVYDLEPNVGDVLNMCYEDEDISFRVEAVLALGRVKWRPRTRGNAKAIERALTNLQKDPNAMVAKAARAASTFTLDQHLK